MQRQLAIAGRAQKIEGRGRGLRQYPPPARQLALECLEKCFGSELRARPLLEEWLGRLPQVELRIELATEAFDIEECLLQQHELRLHLHVETARGLAPAEHTAAGAE